MRQLFILTALTIHLTASGQHDFGLTANGGLSKITADYHSADPKPKFYFVSSGHAGVFYAYHFGDKYAVGTEFLFIQIEGKEHQTIPETDNVGNPTGLYMTLDTWRHISYWGFPIYFSYKYKKINFNLGFQYNIVQKSSGRYKAEVPYNGGVIYSDNKADNLPIDNYDYGVRAGLLYNLTKKFSIETTYYYGLNNIYYISNDWKWKVQQVTVGLRYNIISHGQTSETEKK